MARLDDLPYEVLVLIAKYILNPPHHHQLRLPQIEYLNNFSQCSRRLHAVSIPILYETFDERHHNLFQFCRSIVGNPELARHVKKYVGQRVKPRRSSELSGQASLTSAEVQNLREAVASTGKFLSDADVAGCILQRILGRRSGHFHWEALTAFLLCYLPNLQTLELRSFKLGYESLARAMYVVSMLQHVFHRAAELRKGGKGGNFPLMKVTDVLLLFHTPAESYPLDPIMPLISMCTTKCVIRNLKNPPTQAWYGGPLHFGSSGLTHLELLESSIEQNPGFIGLFPSLKTLVYNDEPRLGNGRSPLPVWLPESLLHLSSCLEVLIVTSTRSRDEDYSALVPFECLRQFEKLRDIAMDETFLLPHYPGVGLFPRVHLTLPRSLERLRLRNCTDKLLDELLLFLNHKEEAVPLLKEVYLCFKKEEIENDHFWALKKLELVEDLARGFGIKFHIDVYAIRDSCRVLWGSSTELLHQEVWRLMGGNKAACEIRQSISSMAPTVGGHFQLFYRKRLRNNMRKGELVEVFPVMFCQVDFGCMHDNQVVNRVITHLCKYSPKLNLHFKQNSLDSAFAENQIADLIVCEWTKS
ncbi:hypothetical protein F5884DRAFT_747128 [Xylogone sp. PMI_703]|nr:hypothetical protein F5884DRAFT_747128 [Xylogone sp. PMI_703]